MAQVMMKMLVMVKMRKRRRLSLPRDQEQKRDQEPQRDQGLQPEQEAEGGPEQGATSAEADQRAEGAEAGQEELDPGGAHHHHPGAFS